MTYRNELCRNIVGECQRLCSLLVERKPGAWLTRLQILELKQQTQAVLNGEFCGWPEDERSALAALLDQCCALVAKLKQMRADNGEMVLTAALNEQVIDGMM